MKKLLIWDGDNTLWEGILTEGIIPKLPSGRFELCETLYSRGVVQSLASNNLQKDAELALHSSGLDRFFLLPMARFETCKSDMIREIMGELGIVRTEDVVFIDDDPFNLIEVNSNLHGVLCINYADITPELFGVLFSKDSYTEEDTKRVAMYRSELIRKDAGKAYDNNRQAFLRDCDMRMIIRVPDDDMVMDRVQDLVKRAHKMSAMGRIISPNIEQELEFRAKENTLVVMYALDKFGEYGLSGVLGWFGNLLDLLTISCRLQGKGYGSAFLGWYINHRSDGCYAEWIGTEYNAGVRSLYEWYGFSIREEGNLLKARREYSGPVTLPDWIEVIDETSSRGSAVRQ